MFYLRNYNKYELFSASFYSKSNTKRILLLSLIIFAVILRVNTLGDHSVWIDEAGTSSLVESFISDGVPQYPSEEESFRSMPYILVTSLSVYFLGLNDFTLRMPSVIFGTLTIILVYKWSEELYGFKSAFIAASILSVSSWHIAMSQNARMYSMFSFLYFLTFYLVYKYSKKTKNVYLVCIGILIILSLLTHITGYILLFTVPLYLILNRNKLSKTYLSLLALFTLAIVLTSQYLYFDIGEIIERFEYSLDGSLQQLEWLSKNETIIAYLGSIGILTSIFKRQKVSKIFLIAIIPPLITYMFLVELKASRYIFFMMPFLAIAISSLFFSLNESSLATNNLNTPKIIACLTFCILAIIMMSANPLNPELGSYSPEPDYKSVYYEIQEQKIDDEILIVGRPLPAAHYMRNPDYILSNSDRESELILNGTEFYSNSPVIGNKTKFNEVLNKHDSGWIVATKKVQRGMPRQLKDEINDKKLIKIEKDIKLWRFQ